MMPFVTGADIVSDILFRAGEIAGTSEWDTKAVDYLNRVYKALCAGSSEFLPEFVDDWWWMRAGDALILDPVISDGTISITNGFNAFTLSDPPSMSVINWKLKIDGHPDVFHVTDIAGGAGELDTAYTGPTNTAATYKLMHTQYNLSSAVQAILSPIVSFRENPQIFGTTRERMDYLFPLQRLGPGVPKAFALHSDTTVIFSHGGLEDGTSMRMEYRYRPVAEDLENTSASIPLVPQQYRHILSDMALVYVYTDKNDDRLASVGTAARMGLTAMVRENRRRLTKIDQFSGAIVTRQGQARHNEGKLLRTESGLIIG